MTSSEGTSPAVANIVWDKSRLHSDSRARHRRAQALKKASSSGGDPTPRPRSRPSSTPPTSSSPFAPLPRPAESELKMSFDPMKDLHMWTMWRVAVNGRIVDETRRRNRAQPDSDPNPFGRALVKTPLDRFIRVGQGSQTLAGVMMDPHGQGGGRLGTLQFVYYGVPRVVLNKAKKQHKVHLPQ